MDAIIPSIPVPAELDARGIVALSLAVKRAVDDPAVRVLALRAADEGPDGSFCRGLSLAGIASPEAGDDPAEATRAFARCLEILRFAEKPTLAIVDGAALGGGLGIVAACDLVLATPRASFGLPELLFGLLPAVILPVLLERMPAQKARLLALRPESICVDRARGLGLVDEIASVEELPRAVRRCARALARTEPGAVADLKRYTAEMAGLDLAAGLSRGAGLTAALLADGTLRDSIRDFVAGGTPPWLTR